MRRQAMDTMVVDGTAKRSSPCTSAERVEEPGDRPDRRVPRPSAIGREWYLALPPATFGWVRSCTPEENVAPRPVEYLLLVANHGDQAAELVGRRGADSIAYSIAPDRSEFYPTDPGVSWELRRNGMPLCGGVISAGMTHVRIDPPAAPAGWVEETIRGFKIKLSANLAANGCARDVTLDF